MEQKSLAGYVYDEAADVIGRGAFATVYKARNPTTGDLVSLLLLLLLPSPLPWSGYNAIGRWWNENWAFCWRH